MDEIEAMEFLLDKMKNTKTNDEFFEAIPICMQRRASTSIGTPLQEVVDAVLADAPKAEALVQAHRRVHLLDVDAHALAFGRGALHQRGQQGVAPAMPACRGQQGDIDDAQLVATPVQVQAADRRARVFDHEELGIAVVRGVVLMLGMELEAQESGLARFVPIGFAPVPRRACWRRRAPARAGRQR
jgi:hypothetical protein